uniref:Importin N-terminal domain-containing protein n=1 Tax=Polytomella parva TaxID=51329 RepID=A0A7S0YI36_9CHLO|mmetsp:Transcript_21523/g.38461  ORF Transcript_21523/g.38461 Transcript_21523/m.38461 type:complete len:405 (+) Transcript_21523:27-1241(+)
MDLNFFLLNSLSNDNEVRKQAEEGIKAASKKPEIIPQLLGIVQQHSEEMVRQLAAVLLRKNIGKYFKKLPAELKEPAKSLLLERIAIEPSHAVRRSVADAVGVLARQTLPSNSWPGLLEFLGNCSSSPEAGHREVALTLFASLTTTVGDFLQPHVPSLLAVTLRGLKDPVSEVQLAAIEAMGALSSMVLSTAEVEAFHGLVGALLELGGASLACHREQHLVKICQLLVDLNESGAPLLTKHLTSVVTFAMNVATAGSTTTNNKNNNNNNNNSNNNISLDVETRRQALQVMLWVAKEKPKQLAKHKDLIREITAALCRLACERDEEYLSNHNGSYTTFADEEEDDMPMCRYADSALDSLTLSLPRAANAIVVQVVLDFARGAAASELVHIREAAMRILAAAAGGR